MRDSSDFRGLVLDAMKAAFDVYERLGLDGLAEVHVNEFGDTALRIDLECEEAVIEVLRAASVGVRVISEEHGVVDIGAPKYMGFLDGLDGSASYKISRGSGRYGTMLGIFEGLDPYYRDYLACGVMEHATGRLYLATRGEGAWLICGDASTRLHASVRTTLAHGARIYIDEIPSIAPELSGLFSGPLADFLPTRLMASEAHYVDVACGASDAAIEFTRKGNLEIAVAYGLVHESGGVVLDASGNDIGGHRYLTFGQKSHVPVITAGTRELAEQLIRRIEE